MNPATVLALISDLYSQVTALMEQNTQLAQERDQAIAERDTFSHLLVRPQAPADSPEETPS